MSEEKQHGTPCITLNCPNRVGQGLFIGDLCGPCHGYLTTMSGKHSQLYQNTRQELMDWAKFLDALEKRAMYETMYEDSEGRTILVITPLDLYSFVSRLWEERSNEQ